MPPKREVPTYVMQQRSERMDFYIRDQRGRPAETGEDQRQRAGALGRHAGLEGGGDSHPAEHQGDHRGQMGMTHGLNSPRWVSRSRTR